MRSGSLWPLAAVPVLESSRAAPSRYGRIRALYFVVAAQSGTGMWRILWCPPFPYGPATGRSEEHTSELQSLMRISYAVFCLKKKKKIERNKIQHIHRSNVTKSR